MPLRGEVVPDALIRPRQGNAPAEQDEEHNVGHQCGDPDDLPTCFFLIVCAGLSSLHAHTSADRLTGSCIICTGMSLTLSALADKHQQSNRIDILVHKHTTQIMVQVTAD